MAPSAESTAFMSTVKPQPPPPQQQQHKPNSFAEICSRRTIANAVNYETSMVDLFQAASTNPTCSRTIHERSNSFAENQNLAPNTRTRFEDVAEARVRSTRSSHCNNNKNSMGMRRRTSNRQSKQRSISLNPISIRYDMELVPRVQKNSNFYSCPSKEPPFLSSVIWRPPKRKDWEDTLSELVAVCTSAGLRQFIALHKGKRGKKPQFLAPLSRDYIRDRIDIDDPLRGVQIRHATQGWLQGYLLWTNFTTWTHYFTWDSLHPLTGLSKCDHPKDADGALAAELQNLPRTGSPQDSGVIFESVAEIALVGGLGCGQLLLKMALEEIIASGSYNFVVLQATSGSRTFYERFGFQRVGAICRYGAQGKLPNVSTPFQGYRHWTHANETQKSLDMHGGPSYMMVLKLSDYQDRMPTLLAALDRYTVADRPKIVATPMSPTPKALKKLKRASSLGSFGGISAPSLPNITSSRKRVFATTDPSANSSSSSSSSVPTKRPRFVSMDTPKRVTPASSPVFGPTTATRRVSATATPTPTTDLFTPPPAGTSLSYAQKQYQSPWLAVPSATSALSNSNNHYSSKKQRKPPRPRSSSKTSFPTVSPLTPKKKLVNHPVKLLPNSSPTQKQVVPFDGIRTVDKATLCKQKVKSYPRDRAHFYNKVVSVVNLVDNGSSSSSSSSSKTKQQRSNNHYFFVLHYDEPKQLLTLCPMAIKGVLSGRRQGRPRYQCVLEESSNNWIRKHSKDCQTVEAFMVMKTPIVAQEAWDILGA